MNNNNYTQTVCRFLSEGKRCVATLYQPTGIAKQAPAVVMAHGFAAQRDFRLPAYAEKFAAAGMAVLLFDYRNFGDSEGSPRHWVSPRRHIQDWYSAIDYLAQQPGIDANRIALWGSSYSGGHVLSVAARPRHPIAAVSAQVPHVNSIATLRLFKLKDIVHASRAGLWDIVLSLFGAAHYSPVVGKPGEFAAMNSPGAWEGWHALMPDNSGWENKVLSRAFVSLLFYSPSIRAARIQAPVLMIAGKKDAVTPMAAAKKMAAAIPTCDYHEFDCGHFDLYVGELFAQALELQIEFFRRHLQV